MCSACARALLSLAPALTIDSLFPYRTTSGCGKGGEFFSPRRLAVSRARDAMDASGQTWHSALHTIPLFQWDAPLLASSQQPLLVASQRNAPLQQPLVLSQREGVAPLQ
ncbi:hypothetical protein B296_00018751 [Ensete ventricosum]|uniref:Uncharacterized protein n=1 Tax=Ensete ventricosum TaxID=4639 RepID=A0A426XYA6_ENSVE|nr:hypothetical protein B296_00018751 [Ensete ventricosum]